MSGSVAPLDRKKHRSLTFSPLTDYHFTAAMDTIPLLAFETEQAAACFALAFPLAGAATPHALLGLGRHNSYLNDTGGWAAPYIPLYVLNYPFSLMAVDPLSRPDRAEVILAVDESAPHFHQQKGVPLYDQEGEPSELLRHITTTLGTQYQLHKNSIPALDELQRSGVLMERNITLQGNGVTRAVRGLRVADHDTVMALPEDLLAEWAAQGIMALLRDHWNSLRHLNLLLDDMVMREAAAHARAS